MSPFGIIMIIITVIWTFISLSWFSTMDMTLFMQTKLFTVLLGYIIIIGITVIAKKIVSKL